MANPAEMTASAGAGHGHSAGAHHAGAGKRPWRPGAGEAATRYFERTGVRAPKIIAWEITRSCNLACAHCRAEAHCKPYDGELSLEECKSLIDDIAAITDPILILTGGEPLMRGDIWEIIDYARARGCHPVIGTNGTLIDDDMARKIAEHGISKVSVSLDFPSEEGQDAFRGQEGAFKQTIEGMRNLRKHQVGVQVNTTVTKMNKHLLNELHDLAQAEDASDYHPFLLVPTGRGSDLIDVELTPEEYDEVLVWAYHRQKTSPMDFKPTDAPQFYRILRQQAASEGLAVTPQTFGRQAMTRGCLGGISFVFISHVGDVQPCGYFDMQLGNVRERTFEDIWTNSPVFDDLRHYDRLKGKCGACEYKGVCGGCRARALAVTGDYLEAEPYCAYVPPQYVEQRVLDVIQSGFPLCHDPYERLAETLGFTREHVIEAIASLKSQSTVRRIGASFESRKMGYSPALCALAVPQELIDGAVEIINGYPGITHNYLRDNRYNIWFTLIAPSSEERMRILHEIAQRTECSDFLCIPANKTYKIRVDFGKKAKGGHTKRRTNEHPLDPNSAFDIELVRWVQGDIVDHAGPIVVNRVENDGGMPIRAQVQIVEHPFEDGARKLNEVLERTDITESMVIERLDQLKENGTIRRLGAMIRHQKIGYAYNAMTVWNIPLDRADDVGAKFARKSFVTHCSQRDPQPNWPYNFYAMIHAQNEDELNAHLEELASIADSAPCALVSLKEFKKGSMNYFME